MHNQRPGSNSREGEGSSKFDFEITEVPLHPSIPTTIERPIVYTPPPPKSMEEALSRAMRLINKFIRVSNPKAEKDEEKTLLKELGDIAKEVQQALEVESYGAKDENEFYNTKLNELTTTLTGKTNHLTVREQSGRWIWKTVNNVTSVLNDPFNKLISAIEQLQTDAKAEIDKSKEHKEKEKETKEATRLAEIEGKLEKLDNLEKTIGTLESKNATLSTQMQSLESKNSTLSTQMQSLEAARKQAEEDLAEERRARELLALENAEIKEAREKAEATQERLLNIIRLFTEPEGDPTILKQIEYPDADTTTTTTTIDLDDLEERVKAKISQTKSIQNINAKFPARYQLPEGYKRGQTIGEWKEKLEIDKKIKLETTEAIKEDYRTYDLIKLITALSTRRYLAVANLLEYIDIQNATLSSSTTVTDDPMFKHLAMAFIHHIIVQPEKTWGELEERIQAIFTETRKINSKCEVLQDTLATISLLTAADDDAADDMTTSMELRARMIAALYDKNKVNKGSSGLIYGRLSKDNKKKYYVDINKLFDKKPVEESYFNEFLGEPSHSHTSTPTLKKGS